MATMTAFIWMLFALILLVKENDSQKICMDELGCFENTPEFFHRLYRPTNVLPQHRNSMNTRFLLYTPDNPNKTNDLAAIDKKGRKHFPINPAYPIRFIVHGFMAYKWYGPFVQVMKNYLLQNPETRHSNVIIVNWDKGSQNPYVTAASNTRVVGAEIALLINSLSKTHGIKPQNCHVIGHSLGAHIAGYAGKKLNGTLGRITALDPANPWFEYMPTSVRVWKDDAQFVDVIHSNGMPYYQLGLGSYQISGHIDFFPNGGKRQPGCMKSTLNAHFRKGPIAGVLKTFDCSHHRANELFINSLIPHSASEIAYACDSWNDFRMGHCADCGTDMSKCALMGIRAEAYKKYMNPEKSVKMYIKTSDHEPFYIQHFQVILKIKNGRQVKAEYGEISIILYDAQKRSAKTVHKESYKSGHEYTCLVTSETPIGKIKAVTLQWKTQSSMPNVLQSILGNSRQRKLCVQYIKVIPMSQMEKSPRPTKGRIFCSSGNIPEYKLVVFKQNDSCNDT